MTETTEHADTRCEGTDPPAHKELAQELARGRQRIAHHGNRYIPDWDGLTPAEQEQAETEARHWVRAVVNMGLFDVRDTAEDACIPPVCKCPAGLCTAGTTGAEVVPVVPDEALRRAAHAVTNARRDGDMTSDYAIAGTVLAAAAPAIHAHLLASLAAVGAIAERIRPMLPHLADELVDAAAGRHTARVQCPPPAPSSSTDADICQGCGTAPVANPGTACQAGGYFCDACIAACGNAEDPEHRCGVDRWIRHRATA